MPRKPATPTNQPPDPVSQPVEKSGNTSEGDTQGISGPERIPQGHGGALLAGGVPGHRGGSGRKRSQLSGLALAKSIGRRHLPGMLRELKRRFYGIVDEDSGKVKKPTVYDQTRIAETVARIVALGEKDLSHEGKKPARAEVMGAGLPGNPQPVPQQPETPDTKPQPAQPPTAGPLA